MMNTEDKQIAALLAGWHGPAPSSHAVTNILTSATIAEVPARVVRFPNWRPAWLVGPALAAALAVGFISLQRHDGLPSNDPLLTQPALNVFTSTVESDAEANLQ